MRRFRRRYKHCVSKLAADIGIEEQHIQHSGATKLHSSHIVTLTGLKPHLSPSSLLSGTILSSILCSASINRSSQCNIWHREVRINGESAFYRNTYKRVTNWSSFILHPGLSAISGSHATAHLTSQTTGNRYLACDLAGTRCPCPS